MSRRFTAIIRHEDGGYVALCPELDIASQGDSIEAARDNLREALALFFECASPAEIDQRLGDEVLVTHVTDDMPQQPRDWKADVDAIRRVLMSEWDPIGCGVPDDEYDSYIPGIYLLMQARVGVADLTSHLETLETERMSLPARPEVNSRVARILLDLME